MKLWHLQVNSVIKPFFCSKSISSSYRSYSSKASAFVNACPFPVVGWGQTALVALVLLVHPLHFLDLYVFVTGQSLGFLSSWPLFALCYHFVLWYCADKVYLSRVFGNVINALGVTVSLPKSLISDIGGSEFTKHFGICYRDWICRPLTKLKEGWMAVPPFTKQCLKRNISIGRAHSERRNERAAPVASDSKRVVSTAPMSEDRIAQDYKLSRGRDNPKTIGSKPGTVRMKSAKMCPADESWPRLNLVSDRAASLLLAASPTQDSAFLD
ncbi:hypothetical protein M9H77_23672 [Catharanthus roseus]|uniref:Uncharacterized protein n=1 Tax=Catharanthus roseus TaxID=4058 RepID=A0ACC0AW39_CATRO|nr:hypothetical protein M9H77_23672 [Catharanthus roseus]